MSVKLRLMRTGRKGQPYYRIVAVDSRKRRDGAYLEKIGQYNPNTRPADLVLDDAAALKWLHLGAVPSDTVRSLFARRGILLILDMQKRGLSSEEIETRVAQFRQTKEAVLAARDKAPQITSPPVAEPVVAAVEAEVEIKTIEPNAEVTPEPTSDAPPEPAAPEESSTSSTP